VFSKVDGFKFTYTPILSLSPAELGAIEELSNKDREKILPLIALRGWMSANNLEKAVARVTKALNNKDWIADIDSNFLKDNKEYKLTGKYPRRVFDEIKQLLEPKNGYENWVEFIKITPNLVPTIQLGDVKEIKQQIESLKALGRGIVVRFPMNNVEVESFNTVTKILIDSKVNDLLIIFDYEDVSRKNLLESERYADLLNRMNKVLPNAIYSVSSSSFPFSFSGSYKGEIPIYERQIFNDIVKRCPSASLVYSDRGGARASRTSGGGGTPPPRIDYPLRNDWRFIRKEFDDPKDTTKEERIELYKEAAREVMASDYWLPDLHLWGVQMIERTSLGDPYGITSANRATAVRINLHLYQQLYYHSVFEDLDTEEDWVD
jgi:hypothetical protein